MRASAIVVVTAAAMVLVACGHRGPSPSAMPASWMGSEHARRGAYMGGGNGEPLPAGFAHELVRDEATLTRNDANGTCFDVRVRTAQELDEPIDALTPRCVVDGTEADGSVARETVTTSPDMPYRVRVETMSAQGIGPRGERIGFAMTQPEDRVLRVVDRAAEVCCPLGNGTRIRLWMRNRRPVQYMDGRLVFDWELRRDAAAR